jgi:hypothetical protein
MKKLFKRLDGKTGNSHVFRVKVSDVDMFKPLKCTYSPTGSFDQNGLLYILCSYYIIAAIQHEAKNGANFITLLHNGSVKRVLGTKGSDERIQLLEKWGITDSIAELLISKLGSFPGFLRYDSVDLDWKFILFGMLGPKRSCPMTDQNRRYFMKQGKELFGVCVGQYYGKGDNWQTTKVPMPRFDAEVRLIDGRTTKLQFALINFRISLSLCDPVCDKLIFCIHCHHFMSSD